MFRINENYLKLPGSYLFAEIKSRVAKYAAGHPGRELLRLGIGDATRPLAPAVVDAMKLAAGEMGEAATFRGYAPDYGYDFLREKIAEHDYRRRGVAMQPDDIFVSDGAKSDSGNIGDILSADNVVAICDPVYPVYADTNAMAGRAGDYGADGRWDRIVYMPCVPENNFVPELPDRAPDVIYLCYPNNPTGAAAGRGDLERWVGYALERGALILYDSAYEAYVTEPGVPRSIYEIEGAKGCAIEFRSFSKTAGFTGTRCAYTVVPKELVCGAGGGVGAAVAGGAGGASGAMGAGGSVAAGVSLNALWGRRQATKLNGVSYVVQRAAEAVYSEEGRKGCRAAVEYYMENASIILAGLKKAGFSAWGGVNAPYIWLKAPDGLSSWELFDLLLDRAGVIGTPGSGFGPHGEGFFRLTAFSSREDTQKAVERIAAAGLL
ncbi:MAG: LL-diaminopimelate aminotransferase [Clostridiales bacterium]|jgi:LL-diaminopimelate aminotransferase|nr:LL-diaminopimelate aminotransferase [Clostridiales bacterium]